MTEQRQLLAGFACVLVHAGVAHAQTAADPDSVEIVEVVGQTPLGAGVAIDDVAANVQHVTDESISTARALDLTQFMQRNLGSVFTNEAQSNPLQPDLQYRGFVGSPLLGLPQGIAVYQDGVRLNEPFGDTVNWALLPDSAIADVYLMPGSNPLFGLNALGGSISLRTRDGFRDPGQEAEVYSGSFGRTGVQAAVGGSVDDFGYFITAEYLEEDGWRNFSPTEAIQVFGKMSWRKAQSSYDLSLALADTDLIGNGPAPVELMAIDRRAIFTRPDITENELGLLNFEFDQDFSDRVSLTGNLYLRQSDIATLNGDDSDYEECQDDPGFICEQDDGVEELILDAAGMLISASDQLEGATINRTDTRQDAFGWGVQANRTADLAGRENLFVAGIVHDESDIDFASTTELGSLDPTRLAVPGGVFVGNALTLLAVDTENTGIFVSNSLSLSARLNLTLSGRYNRTSVYLTDRAGTELNGRHEFQRFNPAVGLTVSLSETTTFYAGYNESSRTPSPVELTCADEDDPCRLPNAFLSDPPLNQVVAETLEAGIRGSDGRFDWHAGIFRTTSRDDILFISAGALTNQGFFDNIGRTRRDGFELNLNGEVGHSLHWFMNYTWLDASFREYLSFPSPNNPQAVAGEVGVTPGDSLPLIPEHLLKAGFSLSISDRLTLAADFFARSGMFLRGDEGNRADEISAASVLGARVDYRVSDRLTVFLSIDNLLDREYESFGLFGEPDEVLGDEFGDPRFLSPAPPRSAWIGVAFRSD